MPIQIDSMVFLLARRLGRLTDGGALRDLDHRAWANFSPTRVRFYFALLRSPPVRAYGRLLPSPTAPPVPPLGFPAPDRALAIMTPVDAIDVAVVARAAQVEHPSAAVDDTLDLAEIVHSRAQLPGTRPPRATRATTLSSDASTRGDPGLGAGGFGPYSLVAALRPIVERPRRRGQLRRYPASLSFPRFSRLADRSLSRS